MLPTIPDNSAASVGRFQPSRTPHAAKKPSTFLTQIEHRKTPRKRFTRRELAILEAHFDNSKYLSATQSATLATRLNATETQVRSRFLV